MIHSIRDDKLLDLALREANKNLKILMEEAYGKPSKEIKMIIYSEIKKEARLAFQKIYKGRNYSKEILDDNKKDFWFKIGKHIFIEKLKFQNKEHYCEMCSACRVNKDLKEKINLARHL